MSKRRAKMIGLWLAVATTVIALLQALLQLAVALESLTAHH